MGVKFSKRIFFLRKVRYWQTKKYVKGLSIRIRKDCLLNTNHLSQNFILLLFYKQAHYDDDGDDNENEIVVYIYQ